MTGDNHRGDHGYLLLNVRRRAEGLADAVLAYSRAFDRYRESLERAQAAGATEDECLVQVQIVADSNELRKQALRNFMEGLPENP